MLKKSILVFFVVIVILVTSVSFALVFTSDEGTWPNTWPKELEKLRKQSRSYNLSSGSEEMWYEIIFRNQEEFEKAWPYILKLKTKGAPLIIENTKTSHGVLDPIIQIGKPGVRILCPSMAKRGFSEETRNRPTHWPDYIKLPSGGLPEYVVYQDGEWIAADVDQYSVRLGIYYRARVDIVLISDGNIVDLNRIPLPPDTPIIDKRFEDINGVDDLN